MATAGPHTPLTVLPYPLPHPCMAGEDTDHAPLPMVALRMATVPLLLLEAPFMAVTRSQRHGFCVVRFDLSILLF